jgi:hypothetical protein
MHPQPLGSIPKDSCKMVANWLVKLLGSTVGSAMARVGVMSIGYDLKGNCGGGLITKAASFRLAIGIESWCVLVGVVG